MRTADDWFSSYGRDHQNPTNQSIHGHEFEGRKPSFLTDLSYLMVGPAWLMSKLMRRAGLAY